MSTAAPEREYLSIAAAADLLDVAPITIRRRIESGELPAVQLGGPGSAIRIPVERSRRGSGRRRTGRELTMSDLTAALREAGYDDIADELDKRALAGELRKAGRDDLADSLEGAGEAPQEETPPERPDIGQAMLGALNRSVTPWFTLGQAPDEEARDAA
jgi:excisionase family DNA binding protein